MNMNRVNNGLAMEGAIALKAREFGITLPRSDRLSRVLFALRSVNIVLRKRMRQQAHWLMDKLYSKEHPRKCDLTGGSAFADITFDGVPCSVKHNSKEIGGHRITPNTVNVLPFPGGVPATPEFADDMDALFNFLEDQEGRYSTNQPWQRRIINELASQAVARELERQDREEVFKRVVGHSSHYLLVGGSKGAMIDGYNFDGSLNCRKVSLPSSKSTVRAYGRAGINRVLIQFDSGFALDWRAHVKGKISPSCLGGSLTLSGVPSGFYREEQ